MTALPLRHPDRTDGGFRPLKAWRHFQKLVANKEDTEQVFHIIEALRDDRFARCAQRFYATPFGQDTLDDGQKLVALLDDHDSLRRLEPGTVGHAYLTFMEREGLTAQGLVDEYSGFRRGQPRWDDQLERYANRLRDTHDLHHILTGYGRDALGEACVLAFSERHTPSWGTLFIAWAGGAQIRKQVPRAANIFGCIREARRMGKAAGNIAHQDIAALLREPLADARKRLNIGKPDAYLHAHRVMREHGLDPAQATLDPQAA